MTQEQKQFIIKALQSGIPALAKEHIDALEEVAKIESEKQEDLNGQETWQILNQILYENILSTIIASVPYMAGEYVAAFANAVKIGNEKMEENRKAREKAEAVEKSKEDDPADKKKSA